MSAKIIRTGINRDDAIQLISEYALMVNPPTGMYRVVNLYVDPIKNKLVIVYDDEI